MEARPLSVEKAVLVVKKTPLEEIVERYNTRGQARFVIEHLGGSFERYEQAHEAYQASLRRVIDSIPRSLKLQVVDRGFLPTFRFGEKDLVLALGPDGLVVNLAKYLDAQPIVALNPDPARVDGVLVLWRVDLVLHAIDLVEKGTAVVRPLAMARVDLDDGQTLHAVNDLFLGHRSHVSARYRIAFGEREEEHSSSGVIVSTSAGSTGWMRSIVTGAIRGAVFAGAQGTIPDPAAQPLKREWEDERLSFFVREPFTSKLSSAEVVCGHVAPGTELRLVSRMADGGVIFSDGIEEDRLEWKAGLTARVRSAEKKARLVVPPWTVPRDDERR